jgi:hypothetical protein
MRTAFGATVRASRRNSEPNMPGIRMSDSTTA